MDKSAVSHIKLFACNSHPALAEELSELMGVPLGKCKVGRFSDGEISITISESVRGADVYVIQSTCNPVNENLMELLIMVDALRRASAKTINAVVPYYGYARQDRKARARDPITAKLIANLLTAAGIDRLITMDLHANQEQGFFDVPVDHMLGLPTLANYFSKMNLENVCVVSPDHGSVPRARQMAEALNTPIAIVDKRRPEPNKSEIMNIIGDVKGKNCIILDDMIDTAGTICNAAAALNKLGANKIYAAATHAVLSGPAIERLEESKLDKIVLLNTIPIPEEKKIEKMEILSVGPVFAETIYRVANNRSISEMFD